MTEPTVKDERYCAYCGVDVDPVAEAPKRFGEPFCSEAHADAFVQEARTARVENATGPGQTADAAAPSGPATGSWDFKRTLKMAACCGLPVLAIVFLAGGGGALLGAGAAVLPYLAALACPLGMFFMMRGMHGHGKGEDHADASAPSRSKTLK